MATNQQPDDEPFAAEWDANPNVERLVHQLGLLGASGADARRDLYPKRKRIPVDEWERLAREALAKIRAARTPPESS